MTFRARGAGFDDSPAAAFAKVFFPAAGVAVGFDGLVGG